jgi:hypothetical protein
MLTYDRAFHALATIAPPVAAQMLSLVPPEAARPNGEEIATTFLVIRPDGRAAVGVAYAEGGWRLLAEKRLAAHDPDTAAAIRDLQHAARFLAREAITETDADDDDADVSIYVGAGSIEARVERGGKSRALCWWSITPKAPSVH